MSIAQTFPAPMAVTSRRETSDHYHRVIWREGRFRIAICRDDLQWLFQRQRRNFRPGGTAWDTLGYCVTKSELTRASRSHIGTEPQMLAGWPERFGLEVGDIGLFIGKRS